MALAEPPLGHEPVDGDLHLQLELAHDVLLRNVTADVGLL